MYLGGGKWMTRKRQGGVKKCKEVEKLQILSKSGFITGGRRLEIEGGGNIYQNRMKRLGQKLRWMLWRKVELTDKKAQIVKYCEKNIH